MRLQMNRGMGLAVAAMAMFGAGAPALAQRSLGIDVSAWQGTISASSWTTLHASTNSGGDSRDFVFIRASRGGTTGEDHRQGGYPSGNNTFYDFSQRYDDPNFVQNVVRATAAGLFVGSYHFVRPDILASTLNSDGVTTAGADNNGTDEASHFIQMAGAWMRPGYLVPVNDLETGSRTADQMAQFCIDFSTQIYQVMGIRPAIYINGSYSTTLQGASASLRNALAQPAPNLPTNGVPSVVSPAYPTLWDARYPTTYNVQTDNPKDTFSGFYGPWDDYGVAQPWDFWQYNTGAGLNGYSGNIDKDVAHGGLEYVKDFLVPAVWVNDSSGDWGTLANWNSGQTPAAPVIASGQLTPVATGPLPTPRLPGVAVADVTTGLNDTVILERPSASITVTLSSGTYNIRKLYMRETLNITGGSLTINYVPSPDSTPYGAQFSGPVTLGGGASLSLHTLQVDATRTFALNGGTLGFNQINLMPDSTTPATLAVGGDVNFSAFSGSSATITNGAGSGSSGRVDLGGGTHAFSVANGVDLFVEVPVANGGLAKSGPGTMHLDRANTYGSGTTISAGTLEAGVSGAIPGSVTNSAGTLKLDSPSAMAAGATLTLAASPTAGAVNLNYSGTQTLGGLYFGTTRKAAGTWGASGAVHTNAAFTGSGILNVTGGPASSTAVSRTVGASSATYGDPLTFTASIAGNSPGGTVQFKADGVAVGSPVPVAVGSASLVVSNLTVSGSPHQITAFYSGDDNNNPSDSSASPISQSIAAKPLTAALTGTVGKNYDGTAAATLAAGNYLLPGVVSGDTVNLNNPAGGTYDSRNAGSGKTVSVTGLAISGPSAANYTLSSTSASGAMGVITRTNLTVTAASNTKTYDGTTSATAMPAVTAGSIQTGDSAPVWTETYDTKNAGTGKTLTAAGTVNDGNGGTNYNITFAGNTNGVINALATSCSLTSSANPSGPGTNVTFTAVVNGVPPAADGPTGNVVFSANGSPFSTNALVSGSSGASTAGLPSGTNAVAAQYVGDGNFLGSTGTVAQVVSVPTTCSQTNALLGMEANLDETFTLTFVGTPQAQYYVLASPAVAAPMAAWAPVVDSTNTVTNVSGLWQFTVTNTASQQFYRSTAVNPCP